MSERSYKIKTDVLREAVEKNGGVVEVAKKLDYKKQRFSHWVTGFNNVPESAILNICRELNIEAIDLLDEDISDFVQTVYPRLTTVYP